MNLRNSCMSAITLLRNSGHKSAADDLAAILQREIRETRTEDQIVMDWMHKRADWDTDVGDACRLILSKFIAASEERDRLEHMPASDLGAAPSEIEQVIMRRLRENRIEGYTLEMAREIAALWR